MNIVKQKWEFFNSLAACAPKQTQKLFCFGLQVLALRSIESLRSNARLASLNWYTAKSKVGRLVSNPRMPKLFAYLLVKLEVVGERDIVAVDFSDFGEFHVLMFAKQTRKGRTIPLYFEILAYPIEKGSSQNLFIIHAIGNFTNLVGCKPKLVFDRGFACPAIIRFLRRNQYVFVIRIKKNKSVTVRETGEKILAKDSPSNDLNVYAYDHNLRLVISERSGKNEEPWYLITNDFRSSREKIIDTYYHRFEIEEFFRDAKRILGLEHVQFKTTLSLSITLWFAMLGFWFLWMLEEKLGEQTRKARATMRLSIIRYYFEQLHKEIILAAEAPFMFVADG